MSDPEPEEGETSPEFCLKHTATGGYVETGLDA